MAGKRLSELAGAGVPEPDHAAAAAADQGCVIDVGQRVRAAARLRRGQSALQFVGAGVPEADLLAGELARFGPPPAPGRQLLAVPGKTDSADGSRGVLEEH